MVIQKELEAKVVSEISTALAAAGLSDIPVAAAWATAGAGIVRWIESGDSAALVSVAVGTPERETFSSAMVSFAATISLFIRIERDPQGSVLSTVAEAIQSTIDQWQSETVADFTRFDLTRLSVDNLTINGGSSPTISDGTCMVAWPLTFKGSFLATTTN